MKVLSCPVYASPDKGVDRNPRLVGHMAAVVVKTNGIPFWSVGEFTTHRLYFSGAWEVHWDDDLVLDFWLYVALLQMCMTTEVVPPLQKMVQGA